MFNLPTPINLLSMSPNFLWDFYCPAESLKPTQGSIIAHVENLGAKLIGHTFRHNSLLNRIIEESVKGKADRNRPPLEYKSQVVRDVGRKTYYELKRKAEKRERRRNAANQPLGC